MEKLKIDHTKLVTVSNYAERIGKTRQTIHNMIKNKELKTIKIDGVLFIKT
jgi:predicted transcriptional regulator